MQIADECLKVLALLPFLVALGIAVPGLVNGSEWPRLQHRDAAQVLALATACALLYQFDLGLALPDLQAVVFAATATAACTLAWALARLDVAAALRLGWLRWAFVLTFMAFFAMPILLEPLRAWDARSIWFFQAKRIFYDDGLDISRGWTNMQYGFSHLDYPKLLPLAAAQAARVVGYWNEYMPKTALLALLTPPAFALAAVTRRLGFAFIVLTVALSCAGQELLWNGYADAYLAAYAALGFLFTARWLQEGKAIDLASGVAFIGLAANLKNEGALAALCTVAASLPLAHRAGSLLAAAGPRVLRAPFLPLALALSGFAVWAWVKWFWGAPSEFFGPGAAARALERLQGPGIAAILKAFAADAALNVSVLAWIGVTILSTATGDRARAAWLPAVASMLYLGGLTVVYLCTPHDLAWHLSTSVERTVLLPACGFFASVALLLEPMEEALLADAGRVVARWRARRYA